MDEQPCDQQIVEMFWQRSDSAIREVQKKYHNLLMHIARNITASLRDAEECVNDTYLKLWNTIPPVRPDSLKNYAARIARNHAIDLYRKSASKAHRNEVAHIIAELGQMLPHREDEIESLELRALTNGFLSTLDQQTRVLFIRRYWLSESILGLSRFFGLKESAVKMRLLRTRQMFKAYLSDGGINE